MILTVRTDTAEAEIGIFEGLKKIETIKWQAGRELSTQLLSQIAKLLTSLDKSWQDVSGIVVFRGPGSFTGLRIGVVVANTIAYAQDIAIVGTEGKTWTEQGIAALMREKNDGQVIPEYGFPANVTKPRT